MAVQARRASRESGAEGPQRADCYKSRRQTDRLPLYAISAEKLGQILNILSSSRGAARGWPAFDLVVNVKIGPCQQVNKRALPIGRPPSLAYNVGDIPPHLLDDTKPPTRRLFFWEFDMHTIEVSRGGIEIGTVQFRGIATDPLAKPTKRHYRCRPTACLPKAVARKIADRLAFGVTAGHEGDFEWHS